MSGRNSEIAWRSCGPAGSDGSGDEGEGVMVVM
jgi:hypothetical protein